MTSDKKIRCTWEGCWKTTTQPFTDGWASLDGWPSPIKDGYYCQAHADAIEAVDLDGGFPE
jgi:hypothetical protein